MSLCHSLNWSSLYFIEPIILFHSAFALHLNSQTLSRFSSPLLFCQVHFSLRIYCPVHTTSLISSKVLSFGVLSFTFIFYRSHTSRFTSLTIFFFQSSWILMSLNTGSTECHRHRQWIITLYYLLQEREILSLIFSLLIWIKHSLDIRLFYLFDLSSCR